MMTTRFSSPALTNRSASATLRTRASSAARTVAAAFGLAGLWTGVAQAQQLPTPFEMVSQLDYECRPAAGAPPVAQLFLRQLNPVLIDRLPNQMAVLGPLEEVCVPVAKNGQIPSPRALGINEWSDLACYHAEAPPVDVDVNLRHLNPQLVTLPDEDVHLVRMQQVCLPVRKNDSVIPPAVSQVVRHLDLACYELQEPTSDANRVLVLSHLNPVIQAMQFPNRLVEMKRARRLCVPVAKNNQPVPPAVRQLVEWADFLKYNIDVIGAVPPPFPLLLTHINPLFAGANPFPVMLGNDPLRLMVPVAKDGQLPPGAGGGPAAN